MMGDIQKAPALALTLRGYIQHAPSMWRAHLAAAADQIEQVAKLRSGIEEIVKVNASSQEELARLAKELAELRDELGALLPEIAAMDRQRTEAQQVRDDAVRTMRECEARMRSAEAERDAAISERDSACVGFNYLHSEIARHKADLAAARALLPGASLTLTPEELQGLCEFAGVDDDDASEIAIGWLSEHEGGAGWYAWLVEYPEEGSVNVKLPYEASAPQHWRGLQGSLA